VPPPRPLLHRRGFALGVTAGVCGAGCMAAPVTPQTSATAKPETTHGPAAPPPALIVQPRATSALGSLLADNRLKDPEHAGGFSNHQSMALTALVQLGADDARLRAFAAEHAAYLEPLRAAAPLPAGDWTDAIGSPAALVGLIVHFEQQLAARGRESVLKSALPQLLPGVGGAVFHGSIRTAYALDAADDAELAHALAYFATVAQPLRPLPPEPAQPGSGAEALLRGAFDDQSLRAGSTIGVRSAAMRAAAEQSAFDAAVAALAILPTTLDDIASVSLSLYLGTRDLMALHAVTSTHALRLLLPYLEQPKLAVRYQFQAVLALGLTISGRKLRQPSLERQPGWPTIVSAALNSSDDHDIKFAFTCHEEATLRHALGYQEAAALRLGLV